MEPATRSLHHVAFEAADIDVQGSRLTLPARFEADREYVKSQLPAFDGPSFGGD